MADIEPDFIAHLSPEDRIEVNRVLRDAVLLGNGYVAYDSHEGVFSRLDPLRLKVEWS